MVIDKNIEIPKKLFVSGIDTDAGKSYVTGILARDMASVGISVITQKFIQTGNEGRSEDIELHRKIMRCQPFPEDLDMTTAPEIYTYPASPHLSAKIDGRPVDLHKITNATERLIGRYDHVLIEGAGGLMVPITETFLTIDYIAEQKLPVLFVTGGKLGSISQTLLGLDALKTRGIELFALAYNSHFDADEIICRETVDFLKKWLAREFPSSHFITIPKLDLKE